MGEEKITLYDMLSKIVDRFNNRALSYNLAVKAIKLKLIPKNYTLEELKNLTKTRVSIKDFLYSPIKETFRVFLDRVKAKIRDHAKYTLTKEDFIFLKEYYEEHSSKS